MSADSTPVRLLQITDMHLFADSGKTLHGVNTHASLQHVLAAAARHPKPDLVLATGDLVHDQPAAYPILAGMLKQLRAPVAAIAGNHDELEELRAIKAAGLQVGGTYRLGGWRILLLNTQVPDKVGGHLGQLELEFLQESLQVASGEHVLIALHHHPVPMRSAWLDRIALDNSQEFFAVLDRYSNVHAVIWGHVHQGFETEHGGVRLLATPSTCVQFLPRAAQFTLDDKPPAMRWLTLHHDGRVETEIEWL